MIPGPDLLFPRGSSLALAPFSFPFASRRTLSSTDDRKQLSPWPVVSERIYSVYLERYAFSSWRERLACWAAWEDVGAGSRLANRLGGEGVKGGREGDACRAQTGMESGSRPRQGGAREEPERSREESRGANLELTEEGQTEQRGIVPALESQESRVKLRDQKGGFARSLSGSYFSVQATVTATRRPGGEALPVLA